MTLRDLNISETPPEKPIGCQYFNPPLLLTIPDLFALDDAQRQALHDLIEMARGEKKVISFDADKLR